MNQSPANHARSVAPAEQLLESLSALMDDEADTLEMRRLVKVLPDTPELADHWRRYHAIRASLRQEMHATPSVDLLPGIKARLQNESLGKRPLASTVSGPILRFIGQGAIAASVAAAVLLAYPLLQTETSGVDNTVASSQNSELPVLNGDFTASPLTRTVSLDAAARDRLQQAVYEFSGTSAVLDADTPMFPAQMVPFEPEAEVEQTAE